MLIGIDFDNTIADYDAVFAEAAVAEGLLAPGAADSKSAVKAAVRATEAGEEGWMRLQGRVYGAHMHLAVLFDGVAAFLTAARERSARIAVISHKTEFGHFDPDHISLRAAARKWMEALGFFHRQGFGIDADQIFFETTRKEKVARIAALKCDHFIDDLPEVLTHEDFPPDTQAHLFSPGAAPGRIQGYQVHGSWTAIRHCVFGDD